MQQRYYDPEIGAFPTTDPVTPFSAGGAFNRYWYASANPYRFTDPDGRQAKTGQNCGEQPCPDEPKPDDKPRIPEQPKGCNSTRVCWVEDGKWHWKSVSQNDQSYLQRVWKRFKSTNQAIPGAITFPGTTLAIGGITANSVDGITAWQAYRLIQANPLSRGPNLIRLSMTSAINFAAVSAAWEVGILGGSMIYEAPTHYGSDITVGEDLGYTIDNAMRSGP